MEAVRPLSPEQNQEEEKQLTSLEKLQEMSDEIQKESGYNYKKYREFLRRIRKGEKIPMEEQIQQKESWDMIRNMQKCYDGLLKICFPKGTKQPITGEGFHVSHLKPEKSQMGEIVRPIPNPLKNEGE